MKSKNFLTVLFVSSLVLSGLLLNSPMSILAPAIQVASADQNYELSKEQTEIKNAILQMFEMDKLVVRDKDTARYKNIYADHPDHQKKISANSPLQVVLPADKQLKDKDGKYQEVKVGMLTYWTARVESHFRVIRMFEEAYAKAKKENRDVSPEDMKSIADQNNGQIPGTMLLDIDVSLDFQSIEVKGNMATANYTQNGNPTVATLIKKGNQWLIVNEVVTPNI